MFSGRSDVGDHEYATRFDLRADLVWFLGIVARTSRRFLRITISVTIRKLINR